MSGFPQRDGEGKAEWNRLKGPDPNPNLPQANKFNICQQTRYDRTIPLKAAAESPWHHKDYCETSGLELKVCNRKIISYSSAKAYVVGT